MRRAMDPLLLGVLGYVAIQLAIGAVVARRVRSEDEYLVAGRRLGLRLATVSIFATWFGAETCVGAAGSAYAEGLGAHTVEPFAYGACLLLMGLVFAAPLWRAGITTLGDLFRRRFGPRVEAIAALVLAPTSLFWASAQIHAMGKTIAASSPSLDIDTAVLIAALVVIVYTSLGGMMADVVTDVFQGAVLVIGLVVVTVAVMHQHGGAADALSLAFGPAPGTRDPVPSPGLLALAESWALPILGSVTAQEVVSRSLAARCPATARRAGLCGGSIYILVGLMPVFLGLIAAHRHAGLDDPEAALPTLARSVLPTIGYVVFAGALVSAILSTVDSALLAAGSVISRNLVLAGRDGLAPGTRLLVARASVIASGIAAWLLARGSDDVMTSIEDASGFGSAGVLVCVLFALGTRSGGSLAAGCSLIAGAATWVLGRYAPALGLPLEIDHPFLASLAAASAGLVCGLMVEGLAGRRAGLR